MADGARPLRVLLVDDDAAIVRLVRRILEANGFVVAAHVATGREALESLEGVDVVLLDHQLPDISGIEVLDAIRVRSQPPAVILITAHGNESLAATALRRGADDYLAKDPALAELLPQILERVRRVRELRKALVAAERDLVRAERLSAIGEMTVTLHHEINNPLMAAFADIELLLARPDPDAERRRSLESVLLALRRIRDIVRQIGDLRTVRSKSYASDLRMLELGPGETVTPTPDRGTALVWVPEEDLARVVGLLLKHAGFQVERWATVADLQAAAGRLGVTLVLLVGAAGAAGAHPLAGFTPAPERLYRLVVLVTGDGAAAREAGADHVVQLPFDPGRFAEELIALGAK
jgi:DNA-binding response OmpR family regulator